MPAGGELAALLARRAIVSGGDNSSSGDVDKEVNYSSTSTPNTATAQVPAPAPAPQSPKSAEEHAIPMRNEELKAIFEERNLEAGIPTPSFLVNARKNLKKPGCKVPPLSPARDADKVVRDVSNQKPTPACSSDNAAASDEKIAASLALEGAATVSSVGGTSSISKSDIIARRSRINASRSSTSSVSSHASMASEHVIEPVVTTTASSLSGDISVGGTNNSNDGFVRANSDSGYNQDTLASRRSRINASRTSTSLASSNVSHPINDGGTTGGPAEGKLKKASPAQMRRQMMVSKIRTTRANPSGRGEINSKQQQQQLNSDADSAVPRTSIISPKRDEFEVLFADDDFVSPGDESIDSIVKEMHNMHESLLNGSCSTAASIATMPTTNLNRNVLIVDAMIDTTNPNTPEKSRIHNASTPKIRGNGNYKRENYDDIGMGGMRGRAFEGAVPSARLLPRGAEAGSSRHLQQSSPSHHSPKRRTNSLPLHQEHHKPDTDDYLPHEPPQKLTPHRANLHDQLPQAYPFRQSPSQMSQMSAITTPSCFPQDHLIQGSAPRLFGDLQQPMLTNETVRTKGSPIGMEKTGVAFNEIVSSERTSAFSPRLEVENQRQREQLSSMARKLEEKDAIISQLMKRISDLESMTASSTRGPTLEYHVNTEGLGTPSSMSIAPHSLGALSNGSAGDPFAMSPVWEHRRPIPQWSNSGDTESELISNASPQHSQQQPSIQKQLSLQQHAAKQRRGRSSLSTAATSSTASVTTSNSSKSGRRSTPRSKSASDSSRQSRKGDQGAGKKNKNDERKFVC